MVELYIQINNKYLQCDLDNDLQVVLNLEMKNYTEFSNNSAFSKTIVLQGTDNNRGIFSFIEETGSVTGSQLLNQKFKAYISYNNFYFFGKVTIQKVVSNYNFHINQIELLFVADINKLVTALTGKRLSEIAHYHLPSYDKPVPADFDQYVDYTLQQQPPYPDIIFGAIDVGDNLFDSASFTYMDLNTTPVFVRLKAIIDAMFSAAGASYTSDSFFNTSNEFKAIYIPENAKTAIGGRSAFVNKTSNYLLPFDSYSNYTNITYWRFYGALQLQNQQTAPYYDPYNLVDDTTFSVTATGAALQPIRIDGNFRYKIKVIFTFLYARDAAFQQYAPPPTYWDIGSELYISTSQDNAPVFFAPAVQMNLITYDNDPNHIGQGVYEGYVNQTLNNWLIPHSLTNENVFGEVTVSIGGLLYSQYYRIDNVEITMLKNEIKITESNYLVSTCPQFSPDIMAIDLLMDVFKMFNLAYIETDKENEYYIATFDTFTTRLNSLDITPYVDLAQNIEQVGVRSIADNKYVYKFKDDNDYYNDYYKKATGRTYGDFIKIVYNEINSTESKIELKTIAPAPYVRVSNVYATVIKKRDEQNNKWISIKNFPLRIVYFSGVFINVDNFYVGYQPVSALNNGTVHPTQLSNTGQATKIPVFTHHANTFTAPPQFDYATNSYTDNPVEYPLYNLNFDKPQYVFLNQSHFTNRNLFTQYYIKNFTTVTDEDGRIMRLKLIITRDTRVTELFQRRLFFRDSYFILNSIKNFIPGVDSICDAELIKTKYIPPPTYITYQFEGNETQPPLERMGTLSFNDIPVIAHNQLNRKLLDDMRYETYSVWVNPAREMRDENTIPLNFTPIYFSIKNNAAFNIIFEYNGVQSIVNAGKISVVYPSYSNVDGIEDKFYVYPERIGSGDPAEVTVQVFLKSNMI